MGVILQVALPSRVLAAARLQCGAAGAGASRGLGVCAEHARLAARGESARAMEIGDFLGRLAPGRFSQCVDDERRTTGWTERPLCSSGCTPSAARPALHHSTSVPAPVLSLPCSPGGGTDSRARAGAADANSRTSRRLGERAEWLTKRVQLACAGSSASRNSWRPDDGHLPAVST